MGIPIWELELDIPLCFHFKKLREHFDACHMVSEKVHIANVRSLTRRPKTFVKFADGVGPCGRAGSTGKSSNEVSRTFGFRLIK